MKVFLIVMCVVFLNVNLFTQSNTPSLFSQINLLDDKGKIEESIVLTKELLRSSPISNEEILKRNIAKKYALIENADSAFLYLLSTVELDSSLYRKHPMNYILSDSK